MRNLVILGFACFVLSACGVKPSTVQGEGNRQTYPDTRMDPAPAGGAPITLPSGP